MNDQLKHAFDAVVAEDRLKEDTRNFLHYRVYSRYRRKAFYGKLAVAFSLVFLLGFGGHSFYFTPVSFISIDVNPSIELGLNRLDRIISVTPFNVDGLQAVENLELKNRKYDEAILMLLGSREMSTYVTEDSQISISVVSDYNEKNEEIQERVMACTEQRYENVSCHSSNEGVVESAHHEGVSFGKYQAFLELQALYPDVTVEDVKNLTMSQIQDLIELYTETMDFGTATSGRADSGTTDSGRTATTTAPGEAPGEPAGETTDEAPGEMTGKTTDKAAGETERVNCGNDSIYGHGHGHSGGKCQN